MAERAVNVGIVGLGFMGRTHFRAYERANDVGRPCRIVAVCDRDADRRAGRVETAGNINAEDQRASDQLFDPSQMRGYVEIEELLADEEVELISICTHTETHPDFAIRALEAGKHVLLEKPVATNAKDVARVVEAARAHPDQIIMPAMCVRFWPGFTWLKDRVDDHRYGSVQSATFHRLGTRPDWARDFYANVERSGGALFDLHIHDVDFLRFLFGDPSRVSSIGGVNHLTTLYHYEKDGPAHAVVEGGWGHAEGFPFQARFIVTFENATADFDTRRGHEALRVYEGGACEPIQIEPYTGWEAEVEHIIDLVSGRVKKPRARIEEALIVTRLLEAERESCRTGRTVSIERS